MTKAEDVLAADQARRRAMIAADVEHLEDAFDDEMVWIHRSGRVDTKRGLIESIREGKTKYFEMAVSEETVRVINDFALINGILKVKAELNDEPLDLENRFTIVWRQHQGKWTVVNWQSTTARTPT